MIVYTARDVRDDVANQSWNPRVPGESGQYSGIEDVRDGNAARRNARRVRASRCAPEASQSAALYEANQGGHRSASASRREGFGKQARRWMQ